MKTLNDFLRALLFIELDAIDRAISQMKNKKRAKMIRRAFKKQWKFSLR